VPRRAGAPYPFTIRRDEPLLEIDWRDAVAALLAERRGGAAPGACAGRFHATVAAMAAEGAAEVAAATGARTVLLSGGVFQNVRLLALTTALLRRRGLTPRIHRAVPANDGGLSLGQAYHAALHLAGS